MKTKDLMVGDWVMHGKKKRKCYNICGHTNDVMLDNGVFTNVMNLEPMSLTLDILKKNGWHEEKDRKGTLILDVNKPIGNDGFECQWMRCNISTLTSTLVFNFVTATAAGTIACDYVHELQHAMRLCGIEKEIIV